MGSGLLARAPFNVEMTVFFSDHPGTATLKDGHLSDHVFQVNFDRGGSQVEINFEGALASSTGGHSKGSGIDLSTQSLREVVRTQSLREVARTQSLHEAVRNGVPPRGAKSPQRPPRSGS